MVIISFFVFSSVRSFKVRATAASVAFSFALFSYFSAPIFFTPVTNKNNNKAACYFKLIVTNVSACLLVLFSPNSFRFDHHHEL